MIKADEKRIDNLFLLEDGTLAIVDYESADKLSNRIKYMNYITRVMEKYYEDERQIPDIRIIIIYTGDVENVKNTLQTTCFSMRWEQAFLKDLNGEKIYQCVKKKLENKEQLSDEELMQLIVLPLTEKGKKNKQKRVELVVDLAKQIDDDEKQAFVVAGVLVSSNQFIDRIYANNVKGWLKMTKVGRLFEEERLEAVRKNTIEMTEKFAKSLIMSNMDIVDIMHHTGLSRQNIEELAKELHVGKK